MRRLGALLALLVLLLLPLAAAGASQSGGLQHRAEPGSRAGPAAECPSVQGPDRGVPGPTVTAPTPGSQVVEGRDVTLAATVPAAEEPQLVRFRIDELDRTVCAQVSGRVASTQLSPGGPGRYTVTATTLRELIVSPGVAPAQFAWFESPTTGSTSFIVVPEVGIDITPRDGAGPVGQRVQWAVTLTADGKPLDGEDVGFRAELPGAAPVGLDSVTDGSGTAYFTNARSVAGVDQITVWSDALGQEASAGTTFTWTEPPLVVALSTSGTSGQVGTPLTWTATVTSGGDPVSGASVRFLGQLDGSPDEDVTLTTGPSGQATHEHTRAAPGTESLQVTATVRERSASDAGAFTWLPAPELALLLSPADSSGEVGTDFAWTATVTLDGVPVEDAAVDFLGELPGQPDEAATGVLTDSDGVASHTHSRDTVGTEALTVTTAWAGQEAAASGQRAWTTPVTPTITDPPETTEPPETTDPPTSEPPTTTDPPLTDPPTTTGPPPTAEPPTTTDPADPDDPGPGDDQPTPIPPIDTPDPPPPDAEDIGPVDLGRNSVIPGGDLAVSGGGCDPGGPVEVLLAGETIAQTTADATGAFTVRAPVPNEPLGQYVVRVQCGSGIGEALVELVSTVASSTAPPAAASAAAVLGFFVLLGSSVSKGVFGSGAGSMGG